MNKKHLPCLVLALVIAGTSVPALAADPWPWQPVTGNSITSVLLLGDFNVQKREDPAAALELVTQTLHQADLVYANLEGLLVDSKGAAYDLPNKSGWTHLGPASVQALLAGNIAAVGVANNVAYGRNNILDSLAVLDANNIAHTGAGKNIQQAHMPAIIEINGIRFGFLQYTSKWYDESRQIATMAEAGIARLKSPDGTVIEPLDLEHMLADIRSTRPQVDVLLVSAHTRDGQGRDVFNSRAVQTAPDTDAAADLYSLLPVNEHLQQVEPYQREFARKAIDAGADIVFGHGCHMLQEVEVYQGKPIMHCLGNFASDWIRVRNYRDGLVARLVFDGKSLRRVSLVPVTRDQEGNNVRLLNPAVGSGTGLYNTLVRLSPSTSLPVAGQEIVLLDNQ